MKTIGKAKYVKTVGERGGGSVRHYELDPPAVSPMTGGLMKFATVALVPPVKCGEEDWPCPGNAEWITSVTPLGEDGEAQLLFPWFQFAAKLSDAEALERIGYVLEESQ